MDSKDRHDSLSQHIHSGQGPSDGLKGKAINVRMQTELGSQPPNISITIRSFVGHSEHSFYTKLTLDEELRIKDQELHGNVEFGTISTEQGLRVITLTDLESRLTQWPLEIKASSARNSRKNRKNRGLC